MSPNRHRALCGALLLSVALGGGASCRAPGDAGAAPRGVVRVGWTGGPDSLNPGIGVLSRSFTLYGLVYDTLFEVQLDGSYAPAAVESFEKSADSRVWTLHLRPGQSFHDGHPLDAGDVKFSLELYRAHQEFPYLHGYTTVIESIEIAAPLTLVVTLEHALADFEIQLGTLFILPEHVWAPIAGQAAGFDNAAMIGSGPFALRDYRPGESVRLTAHRAHPRYAPEVDELVFVSYGNGDALVQALRTGEVDAITELPVTSVPTLRREPRIEVVSKPGLTPRTWDIKLNQRAPERCTPPQQACTGHPALRDLTVRRALAMATPKQELLDVLLLGSGRLGRTLLQPSLGRNFHSELADHPHDPAAANRALDAAGYLDSDRDGVREMPDGGRPLAFRFYFPSSSAETPRAAELIARAWERIGVRLERRALDANALAAARAPALDYDVILWSWTTDLDPAFLLSVMAGDEIAGGANDTGWTSAEFDALYLAQARELDVEARRKLIWRMQEIAHAELPYIVPFYPDNVQAFRRGRFDGWRTDMPLVTLEDRSSLARLRPAASGPAPGEAP